MKDWFNTLASGVKVPAASALAPLATLNDGNVCEDDEELFPQNLTTGGALCYKRFIYIYIYIFIYTYVYVYVYVYIYI